MTIFCVDPLLIINKLLVLNKHGRCGHNVVSTVRKNTLPFKSLRSVSFYFGKSLKLTKPITPVFSVP